MTTIIEQLRQTIDELKGSRFIVHVPSQYLTEERLKNMILSLEEEKQKLLHMRALPYHYVLEPTNICNLRCPLCSTGSGSKSRPKGRIKLEQFKLAIDQIAPYALDLYLQNWGESTLVEELPAMISYVHSKNIWSHLSSNFSIKYKPGFLDALMHSGLDVLHVDLDGTDQETYSAYRIGGKIETVIENIRHVVALKKENNLQTPLIEVTMMVMKQNEHQIEEFNRMTQELGVDLGSLGRIQINPKGSSHWLPDNKEYVYNTYVHRKEEITQCHWLWSGMAINWDGNVSPCCIVDDARTDFGSLFSEKLESVWNNAHYQSSRAAFTDPSLISEATICTVCKNDTHNPELKRYKDTFSIVQ